MSLLKDWLNLFAVSVSATVSAAISFFCHDTNNLNAANSEMLRVNTFVNFLLSFIENRENKQAGEEIHSFSSLKLSKYFWTELGMIPKNTLSQKRSLH